MNDSTIIEGILREFSIKPAELARRAEIPQATISRILNGRQRIGRNVARRLETSPGLRINPAFIAKGQGPVSLGKNLESLSREELIALVNVSPEEMRYVELVRKLGFPAEKLESLLEKYPKAMARMLEDPSLVEKFEVLVQDSDAALAEIDANIKRLEKLKKEI